MDKGTGIGLGVALVAILGAAVVEAGSVGILFALMNLPSAMIVFGGTLGTLLIAFPLERVTKIGKVLGVAFHMEETSERDLVNLFVKLAERARREGLLALETEAQSIEDEAIKKGVMLVVDGTDPELVREIMESDVAAMSVRLWVWSTSSATWTSQTNWARASPPPLSRRCTAFSAPTCSGCRSASA
jgi:chemotaxis protein MotA